MRSTARKVALALIAVLLATVLTPSFGWEASAGRDAPDQSIAAPGDPSGTHDRHDDEPCNTANLHHHGCAAHMFGHLPAYFADVATFSPPDLESGFLLEPDARVVSVFLERLDRPPLDSALA